jgi:hypothetical protein
VWRRRRFRAAPVAVGGMVRLPFWGADAGEFVFDTDDFDDFDGE